MSCGWTNLTAALRIRCSTIRYWAPDDPQRSPYDDTGWTFGELFNVRVVRVTDPTVLDATMEMVKGELMAPGGLSGTGSLFAVNHNADPKLATLRYRLKDAQIDIAEEAFESAGQKFNRGSFIIRNVSAARPWKGSDRARVERRSARDEPVGQDAPCARGPCGPHAHLDQHAG